MAESEKEVKHRSHLLFLVDWNDTRTRSLLYNLLKEFHNHNKITVPVYPSLEQVLSDQTQEKLDDVLDDVIFEEPEKQWARNISDAFNNIDDFYPQLSEEVRTSVSHVLK